MSYFERENGTPDIYYREAGEGPAIMLFNGLSQSTANWTSQISALSDHFRVIAWDGRGQGRTELGDEQLNLGLHVSDAVSLLDHLNIDQAHMVGFSHGARVALSVAAHHPDRTASLALTSIGSDDNPYRNLIIRVWSEVLELGGIEALAWVTTTHILGREFLEAHADQVDVMIKTVKDRNSEEALRAMIKTLSGYPPSLDEAAQVEATSALMTSTQDPLVSDDAADSLAEVLDPTHRWSFEDCGHTIPVEKPKQWRENLLEFLGSVAD